MGLRKKITAFGERVSDGMAKWGASWTFLMILAAFMWFWMEFIEPAPWMRFNLILSLMAAVQAPIIMMSQRRQEAHQKVIDERDRQREIREAENQLASLEAQHAVLGDIRTMIKKRMPEGKDDS